MSCQLVPESLILNDLLRYFFTEFGVSGEHYVKVVDKAITMGQSHNYGQFTITMSSL